MPSEEKAFFITKLSGLLCILISKNQFTVETIN